MSLISSSPLTCSAGFEVHNCQGLIIIQNCLVARKFVLNDLLVPFLVFWTPRQLKRLQSDRWLQEQPMLNRFFYVVHDHSRRNHTQKGPSARGARPNCVCPESADSGHSAS